jgi:hypothetical protein
MVMESFGTCATSLEKELTVLTPAELKSDLWLREWGLSDDSSAGDTQSGWHP